ncbi:hypothetical protein LZ32DRAFT_623671 [Colletotrichum eremochloae]|nr:hypothetical protein LZ32DRAFT_623671 [Colletotrichum eremochloae]
MTVYHTSRHPGEDGPVIEQNLPPVEDITSLPSSQSGDNLTSEAIITELQQGINEICRLCRVYGPKLPELLFANVNITNIIFPDVKKLNLTCLGDADHFTNEQQVYIDQPKIIPGEFPVLYWLLRAVLHFSTGSSGPVLMKLRPPSTNAHVAPKLDIQLGSENRGLVIQLTYFVGGKFHKFEVLRATLEDCRVPFAGPRKLYGQPIPIKTDASQTPIASDQSGWEDILKALFPRSGSKWRHAMSGSLGEKTPGEEDVLVKFAEACWCPDDNSSHRLSDTQDEECRRLVLLSPCYAREFLQGLIGKPGGPLRYRNYGPPNGKD